MNPLSTAAAGLVRQLVEDCPETRRPRLPSGFNPRGGRVETACRFVCFSDCLIQAPAETAGWPGLSLRSPGVRLTGASKTQPRPPTLRFQQSKSVPEAPRPLGERGWGAL